MKTIQPILEHPNQLESKLAIQQLLADDIARFSKLFPSHIQSTVPLFHKEIYALFTKTKGHKGVAAPRGFSKSTITDLVYLAYLVLTGKRHFIIMISDTFTQATMLLEALKEELESNELVKEIYGNVLGNVWANDEIIVIGTNELGEKTSTLVMAKGAGMKIRGLKYHSYRPDLILMDDLENDELVESPDRRRKLKNWLKKGVLPALSPDGEVIVVGTVLHTDSLLNNILERKDEFTSWNILRYKALNEGESLWPDRFSVEELTRMRDDPTYERYMGPVAFSQEMQNEPINEEDQIIKPEWLQVEYSLQQELNKFKQEHPETDDDMVLANWLANTFRSIRSAVDPAISEKTSADYWAMVTTGIRKEDGHIFVLDIVRLRESDPIRQVNIVLDQFQQWRDDRIKIESVAYQKGLYQLIKRIGAERGIYPPIQAFTPDRDKVRRAIMHSANFAGGLVHLRTDHPLAAVFKEEIMQFPQGTHDDMFDAYMSSTEDTVMKTRSRTFANKPAGF